MIDLKTREKFVYYNFIKNIILIVTALPATIFGIVMIFISIVNSKEIITIPFNISMIFLCIAAIVGVFFILFDGFYKKKLRRMTAVEFYHIVEITKIQNNPKVVYIFTCHNDLIDSRLRQNLEQTYSNIEVWLSDGSTDESLSAKYKTLAQELNIKYFKIPGGSINKSHNLNTFLEKINPTYDYLLITDADEVLDNHFVEYAIKCFNSPQFNNLGFVSPLNYCYETQTLFSNVGMNLENTMFYKQNYTRTITLGDITNLVSFSCLISKDVMQVNNNRFPSGSLEDFYLEYKSLSNGFVGICLPITPCGQSFDKTIWHYFRRVMRIYDWSIKLVKDGAYNVYNEKYSGWYLRLFGYAILLTPFIYLLILIAPLLLWFIVVNYKLLFTNPIFITLFSSLVLVGIASIITALIETSSKYIGNKYAPYAGLFSFFYGLSFIPLLSKHWFNALFRGKYSGFVASHGNKKIKTYTKECLFICIVSMLVLIAFVLCYAFLIKFALNWMLLLFFYVTIILLMVFFCSLSFIVLNWTSNKITNENYNENDFIYPKEFYQFVEERKLVDKYFGKEANND